MCKVSSDEGVKGENLYNKIKRKRNVKLTFKKVFLIYL